MTRKRQPFRCLATTSGHGATKDLVGSGDPALPAGAQIKRWARWLRKQDPTQNHTYFRSLVEAVWKHAAERNPISFEDLRTTLGWNEGTPCDNSLHAWTV